MKSHLRISLLIATLYLFWVSGSAALDPSRQLVGIAPQDESYYGSKVIKCRDGSKKFTIEQLNDDFCDCPDGTDEPGTSACPEGKFYCRNSGHAPLTIFSSRVNDGICDCCDGSDEYDGKVSCANTCWEAGKVAREKLKKKIATYQDGVVVRQQEVDKAKHEFSKDEAELSKLKSEEKILKDLVQKLKDQKERIEKAEEEERLTKEKEEKRLREAEKNSGEQDVAEGDVVECHADTPTKSESEDDAESAEGSPGHHLKEDQDVSVLEVDEVVDNDDTRSEEASDKHSVEEEHSADTEGLSREELGRLVASRWTGENAGEKATEIDNTMKEEDEDTKDIPDSAHKDDIDNYGYTSENDESTHKSDDEDFGDGEDDEYEEDPVDPIGSYNPDEDDETDFSEVTASDRPSWMEKIQQTVQNVLQSFNFFKTPVDISEAAHVRKEYDDSSSKLSKVQSRISRLSEKLKHDFGKDKQFYSFYDHCFENKENKYVYKVCPFKKASQVEGHSTTQLGHWDKFDDSYRVMQFTNGDKCWNGPDRSLKVRLRCGLKNELTDVDEPSRCEYAAMLSTPMLCVEDKLTELQQKLERMNTNQPPSHDEL